MIVNHDALLVAIHVQPAPAVTATVPDPPVALVDCELGLIEKAHGAACVTVKVCPAIVRVSVRSAPVFAAIVKVTVPLPLPLAP